MARSAALLTSARAHPAAPALILLLGMLLTLSGCSSTTADDGTATGTDDGNATGTDSGTEATSETEASSAVDQDQLSIAVVGDSITQASAPTFAPGQVSEDSWVSYAVGDPIQLTGGWARWGATTAEMAAAASPVDAEVLVIMAGTNDLAVGTETGQVAADLQRIVEQVGADQVLLCAVPPMDARPEVVPPFNDFLAETAARNGWAWVDPAAGIREDGTFAPGMSVDGLHPTQAGATQIGAAVREALLTEFAPAGQDEN
ncbi:MAG TPA: SGNH/GDSL hydrolase family protein [Candidatus Ruania gallistercoris]|uniref:SGNH/GDSL hydrolase family protein n=1 Tax=Candidatus Ruania gallistercoris TaxID=2838746 RepID=A0A9D2EJ05_9MICO|nr:SGNH/GDSL hydrolase family protein [Candidatus Ruania gallistercoris]